MPWVSSLPYQAGENAIRISDEKVRFFWCTDSHAAIFDAYMDNLIAFVEDCNVWRPQFVVHTGDMGSNSVSSVYNVWGVLRRAFRPLIIAIGNHDEEETTYGECNPNTAPLRAYTMWDQNEPFCKARQFSSGDGAFKVLAVQLDQSYYGSGDSVCHVAGDRMGWHPNDSDPYYTKMLGGGQLEWLSSVLAADGSDALLIFMHQRPDAIANGDELRSILDAVGKPMALFCGHNHTSATATAWGDYIYYKAPAMQDANCWVRVALSLVGGILQIDEMEVQNYTDPGGWTINAPFTLAA